LERLRPRIGHAVARVGAQILILGGMRKTPSDAFDPIHGQSRPEGPYLNDVLVLDPMGRAAGAGPGRAAWRRPAVRGTPPRPRRAHSASFAGASILVAGGIVEGNEQLRIDDAAELHF
jgi:hypothetical protein